MRINTEDLTLKRNYLQKYRFLIKEYELVKSGRHPRFRFVNDFYSFHHTDRRSFLKYYGRYKQSGREEDLLPRKRGPKFKTRRTIPFIEQKILELRALGNGRYEIHRMLKGRLKGYTPTPSTIYNIFMCRGRVLQGGMGGDSGGHEVAHRYVLGSQVHKHTSRGVWDKV
jgi:hypothetical protein